MDEIRRQTLMGVAIAVIGLLIAAGLGLTRQANNAAGAEPDVLASTPAHGQPLVAVAAGSTTRDATASAETRPAAAPPAVTAPAPSASPTAAGTAAASGRTGAPTGAPTGTSGAPAASTPSGTSPAGAQAPGDGVFLDPGAAVAAKVTNGPAAPAFDQALVDLSAKERLTDQQIRAQQATHANRDKEQARRVVDQAAAAKAITAEQTRLVDAKKKAEAEAAAALLKAQQQAAEQAALAADAQSTDAQSTDSSAITLPDGTLVRPLGDGTWPASVLAQLKNVNPAPGGASGRTVAPVAPGNYVVGARFGAVGTWASYHTGVDFSAPMGTPIRAAADGVVVTPVAGDWAGTHVIIAHSDGYTLYAHMIAAAVKPGQVVRAGDVIGYVGETGRAFGPHLHFEYYPRGADLTTPYSARDPLVWLASRGVTP